jgi:hypothetical protein
MPFWLLIVLAVFLQVMTVLYAMALGMIVKDEKKDATLSDFAAALFFVLFFGVNAAICFALAGGVE